MRPVSCRGCELPVLELRGQVAVLDSYYISGGQPPETTAGRVACAMPLRVSGRRRMVRGPAAQPRDVRGLRPLAELERGTVVRHPRTGEALAFGRGGELLSMPLERKGARSVDGGAVYPVFEAPRPPPPDTLRALEGRYPDTVRDRAHRYADQRASRVRRARWPIPPTTPRSSCPTRSRASGWAPGADPRRTPLYFRLSSIIKDRPCASSRRAAAPPRSLIVRAATDGDGSVTSQRRRLHTRAAG